MIPIPHTLTVAGYSGVAVVFACGHVVDSRTYEDVTAQKAAQAPKRAQAAVRKYWNDQRYPHTIGSVAPCPHCKGRSGQLQVVTRIEAVT